MTKETLTKLYKTENEEGKEKIRKAWRLQYNENFPDNKPEPEPEEPKKKGKK